MTLFHSNYRIILRSFTQKFAHKHAFLLTQQQLYSAIFTSTKHEASMAQKLYQKDWLSPNEVVKIFSTLEPSTILPMLDHLSKRKDFKPNAALYNVVINKLAQNKNFAAIDDIYNNVIKTQKNLRLSDGFFYDLIRVYGNVDGLIDRAIETLFEMPEFRCWPSVKTFNLALNLGVSSRRFDLVHGVFTSAAKLGVEIDACSLNIMIKGLCRIGALEDALQVFDEFPRHGCERNKMTYSTIMHCMCEKGKVDEAFELLGRMEKEGISPDAVTFNVLVSGLRKHGTVEAAMVLLDRMRSVGCDPNKGTYQEVLYGLLKARRFLDAKMLVQRMRSKALIPSFSSYKMLVEGFCEEDLLGEVEWVLNSIVLAGFVPRIDMWNTVLEKMFSRHDTNSISLTDIVNN